LGSDAELKALATKDLSGADSAEQQAALGDGLACIYAVGRACLARESVNSNGNGTRPAANPISEV
jgi:hypothetical protein